MRSANNFLKHGLLVLTCALGATMPAWAQGPEITYGDDTAEWANDGECDDARFTGAGMSLQPTEAEIMHDATDCEAAFKAGTVTLIDPATAMVEEMPAAATPPVVEEAAPVDPVAVEPAMEIAATPANSPELSFGDDESDWSGDGECDDARFTGEGMAQAPTEAEIMHDATDCRAAHEAGRISLLEGADPAPVVTEALTSVADEPLQDGVDAIDFGDNDSSWSKNGICDDPRFQGSGMASVLNDSDTLHDAADCRTAFDTGTVTLKGSPSDINFGDDSAPWPNDGECDDPRFAGEGMARNTYTENMANDATDCRAAFDLGTITYQGEPAPEPFDYGSDSSAWANDGECDDLRFAGPGTDKKLLTEDIMSDASDCRMLEEAGSVFIRTIYTPEYLAGAPYDSSAIDFGDNSSDYADDEECDDPRFEGPDAAYSPSDSHRMADANDCRTAYEAGRIMLIDPAS